MNLQPRKEQIVVQEEFLLNTQGLIFKVGGITLDGSAFNGIVKAGTAVMKGEDDLFIPYADSAGAFPDGAEVYLTAQDAIMKTDANNVIGAVVKAYVKTDKLTGVTDAFKAHTADSRYIYG